MTPHEKALELVGKYSRVLPMNQTTLLDHKNCALIAVDEILNTIEVPSDRYIYWQEVKTILEKSNHNDLYGKDKSNG